MIGAELLSPQTLAVGWLVYVPVLAWAVARAPWVELCTDSRRQHLLLGTVFALFMLWLVRRDFDTGVSYHFIGLTAVTGASDVVPVAIEALRIDDEKALLIGNRAEVGQFSHIIRQHRRAMQNQHKRH